LLKTILPHGESVRKTLLNIFLLMDDQNDAFAALSQPFCNPFATILQPFCNHFATILQPFCNHFAPGSKRQKQKNQVEAAGIEPRTAGSTA
jgi:hypothetical protein